MVDLPVPSEHQQIQTLFQKQQQEHDNEVNAIIDYGKKELGTERVGEIIQTINNAFGDPRRVQEFGFELRKSDIPLKVLAYLDENPERLAQFAKLPPNRLAKAMVLLETQLAPSKPGAFGFTSAEPAWKGASKNMSDADFNSPLQDTLSDKEYDRIFNRKMEERRARGQR